ncbi:response regulator [uncultured Cohaesibacter sp.]|uniref:response regulator n=1 Tax=uncultured Cohaesibacter sp. TaxID=1002546 RepID=UPI002A0A3316|nr:response regulator [uncultured Cohaesibacter sp.]
MPVTVLSALRVLVIEDSAYMRTIIRTILQGLGVREIFEAEDGGVGLEKLEQLSPDLLIIDWVLPILDGPELVRLVRNPNHPMGTVPIIMISSYAEKHRIMEAKQLGVHEFLRKPFSAKDMYLRIVAATSMDRPFVRTDNYYGPAPRESVTRRAGDGTADLGQSGVSVPTAFA